MFPETGQEPLCLDFQHPCGTELTEVGADAVETLKGPVGYHALGGRDGEVVRDFYDDSIFPGPQSFLCTFLDSEGFNMRPGEASSPPCYRHVSGKEGEIDRVTPSYQDSVEDHVPPGPSDQRMGTGCWNRKRKAIQIIWMIEE